MNKDQIINAIDLVQKYIDKQFESNGQFAITEWVIATDKNYEINRVEKNDNGTICVVIDFVLDNGCKTWKQGRCFHVSEDETVR